MKYFTKLILVILLFMLIGLPNIYNKTLIFGFKKDEKTIENNFLLSEYSIEQFYKVTELEPVNNSRYQYQILNKNGNVVLEDITFRLPPDFSLIDKNIMRVRIHAGTNVYSDIYYDITNDKLSQPFYSPYKTFEHMVATVEFNEERESTCLIVQDMFEQNRTYLYEEIDFANKAIPVFSVKKLEFLNEQKIYIEYEDSNHELVKKELNLEYND